MNKLKIFPSIGIARVGNSDSDNFFLCPEKEGSMGIELDSSNNESEVRDFKVSEQVKKQGARFKIFEEQADGRYLPLALPLGSVIKWTVRLVNKKTATERTDPTIFWEHNGSFLPPLRAPKRVPMKANDAALTIDSGNVDAIQTPFANRKPLSGNITISGSPLKSVQLGSIFTDGHQNLVVLGGNGRAEGGDITNFYTNETWFDDTSDGYIKAEIIVPGFQPVAAEGAWVIVAPTDYSPGLHGIVSLYDQLLEVAVSKFNFNIPHANSFKMQIRPMIEKFINYQWVEDGDFTIVGSLEQLSNNQTSNKTLREQCRDKIKNIPLDGHPGDGRIFRYTATQIKMLDDWANGSFKDDNADIISIDTITGNYFTATVLKTTVGQGFFPGIEAGMILCNPDIYAAPFTIDHEKVAPGDITGLMALPWQADFLECAGDWWPTQRPYDVRPDANDIESVDKWQRPMRNRSEIDGVALVKNIHRLAFIKARQSENGIVYVEEERDSTLSKRSDLII